MGCVAATARGNGSHLWLLLLGDPCLQARVTAIQEFEVSVSDDQRNLSALPIDGREAPLHARPDEEARDRLWVNDEGTVLVRLWASGTVEVATRDEPGDIWGPPVYLKEER